MEKQLIKEIKKIELKNHRLFIGIDGLGGAGKSTLAKSIRDIFNNVSIIFVDDFYKPINQRDKIIETNVSKDFDWDRMEREVFRAHKNGDQIKYRKFNWDSTDIGEQIIVPLNDIIIVEGVYSTQKRFQKYYDFTIWVETSKEQRIKNMTLRVGEKLTKEWINKWMYKEDRYYKKEKPYEKVDH